MSKCRFTNLISVFSHVKLLARIEVVKKAGAVEIFVNHKCPKATKQNIWFVFVKMKAISNNDESGTKCCKGAHDDFKS